MIDTRILKKPKKGYTSSVSGGFITAGSSASVAAPDCLLRLARVLVPVDKDQNELSWDAPLDQIFAIKSVKGLFSEEFLSARGLNPFEGETVAGGLDEAALAVYLTKNHYAKISDIPSLSGYATETWVEGKGYLTSADISGLATEAWVGQQGYLKGTDLQALTFQAGAFSAKTYTPNSGAATVSIPTTTTHISEGTNLYFTEARAQDALDATVTSINNTIAQKLDKSVYDIFLAKFDSMFEKVNIGTESAPKWAIKAKLGLYSEEFLSARGLNPFAGSGIIGASALADLTDVSLGSLSNGQALVYNGSKWVNQTINIPSVTGYATLSYVDTQLALKLDKSVYDTFKAGYDTWKSGVDTFKTLFESMFEKKNIGTASAPKWAIFAKMGVYTDEFLSARGINSSGSSGGGSAFNLMRSWPSADPGANTTDALGANLGWELRQNKADKTWVEAKGYLTAVTRAQVEAVLTGNVTTHTHSQYLTSLPVHTHEYIVSVDTRNTATLPNSFSASLRASFKSNTTNGLSDGGSYNGVLYFKPYGSEADMTGGYPHEIGFTANGNIWHRIGTGVTTWGAWHKVLTDANYTSVVTTLRDRTNGTATYLNYGAAGISSPSWFAAWNGYELRAISPANVLAGINALSRDGGSMTNTNVVTNLNADLLDGKHNGELTAMLVAPYAVPQGGGYMQWYKGQPALGTADGNGFKGSSNNIKLWSYPDGGTVESTTTANIMNIRLGWDSNYWCDIFMSPNNQRVFYRKVESLTAKAWREFAFKDDNVASATKLQTARSIWGQSFNGEGNVSGNLSLGASHIQFSENLSMGYTTAGNRLAVWINASNAGPLNVKDLLVSNVWADYTNVPENGIYTKGHVKVATTTDSYALNAASFICDSWIRTKGGTGWYNETYGGGWYMTDTNFVRTSHKPVSIGHIQGVGASGFGVGLRLYSANHTSLEIVGGSHVYGFGAHNNGGFYIWHGSDFTEMAQGNKAYFLYLKSKNVGIGIEPLYKLDVNGTTRTTKLMIGSITLEEVNGNLHIDKGVYSDSFVSARGANSSGGSGSGGVAYNRLDAWSDYATGKEGYVLSAKLGYELYTGKLNNTKAAIEGLLTGTITSHSHNTINVQDVRGASRGPNYFGDRNLSAWFNSNGTPDSNWWSGIHVKGWTGAYAAWELAGIATNSTPNNNLYFRTGINDTWNAWQTVVTSANIGSYAITAHQSLANYVTLDTAQTIAGAKAFSSSVGINQTDGTGVGISLYGGTGYSQSYGILFGVTGTFGKHGAVQGDWATYFTMDGAVNRGWVFRHRTNGNVASVNAEGKFTGYSFESTANNATSWWLSTAVRAKFAATNGGKTDGWSPAFGFKTTAGKYEIGSLADTGYINYYADTRTTNGIDYQLTLPKKTGTLAVTSDLSAYLPLTGGTLKNGSSTSPLTLNTDATNEVGVRFFMGGTQKGWVGYNTTYGAFLWNANGGYLGIRDNGSAYVGNNLIWHAGNDGSGSGLDADLLDGYHKESFNSAFRYRTDGAPSGWYKINIKSTSAWMLYFRVRVYQNYHYFDIDFSGYNYGTNHWYEPKARLVSSSLDSVQVHFGYDSDWNLWVAIPASNYTGLVITDVANGYKECNPYDLFSIANMSTLTGTIQKSYTLSRGASLSDNVASATKLQTARTIWGQSFNGEGNVTGNLTLGSGSSIIGKDNVEIFKDHGNANVTVNAAKGDLYLGYWYTNNVRFFSGNTTGTGTEKMILLTNGNVGIGTSSPQYKLHVEGTSLFNDDVATGDGIWLVLDKGRTSASAAVDFIRTGATLMFGNNVAPTKDKYNPLTSAKTTSGYYWGLQAYNDNFGIYISRTAGKCENSTVWNTANGELTHTGNFKCTGTVFATVGIYSNGYVSARGQNTSSDARLKRVLGPVELRVADIARAPSVRFVWRKEGTEDVGSLAQYWRALVPQLAPDMPDGSMGLQYGKTALLGLISVARETESLGSRVESLERRVESLERENMELRRQIHNS